MQGTPFSGVKGEAQILIENAFLSLSRARPGPGEAVEGRRLRCGRCASGRALAVAALGPGGARGGRRAGQGCGGLAFLSGSPQGYRSGVWLIIEVLSLVEPQIRSAAPP